ncbi:MAG: xanthine dehydrogenase family protein molybdopterin-binding subunit [Acidobacteria bacterium]|nr:xanthine dehydrogenase family protein molybdopterin-binding subunit [Acidobacteriota bacterium]
MTTEPERYELAQGPAYRFELDRRDFFQLLGAGLVVVLTLPAQESGRGGRRGSGAAPKEIAAWLHVGEDGLVTVYTGKAEVGQNTRTALTQAVAEELRLPVASVRLVMADTDLTPFDMGTFGSMSTPQMAPQLRRAAAAARELLLDRAAGRHGADRASLKLESLPIGQLTKGQKLTRTIDAAVPISPPAGRSTHKVDGLAFVTGKHKYTPDLKLPGMLHGAVLRPPAFGASLVSLEPQTLPGVTVVRDGPFAGVAASTPEEAARALQSLRPEWKSAAQPKGQDLFRILKDQASDGRPAHTAGSIPDGLAASDRKLVQTYTVAYIAHAPLEPRAALAEWKDDRLTVWTGTQRPFGVRGDLAQAFGIPESRVRVIVPDTGAGYGGKPTAEASLEAARLARASGRPVKVVWTREEEFTWAYFRPAGVIEVSSGVTQGGLLQAWDFHNYNSGASAIRTLYDVPNQRIVFHPAPSPLKQGSYRGLAATANHFARETHMDELAHLLKIDPLEFRLKNLKDPRLRAVLEAVAAKAGRGWGIAGGFEKGSYVATAAGIDIHPRTGAVKVTRVVAAFECGAVVNPDHLKNQIEGAIVQGLGGALFEAVDFDGGRILNPRFSRYRVPRFSDAPEIEVLLLDRRDLPSAGAGETPIVAIAPAVGNAIFHATGHRLRSLPMVPAGLKS